MAERTVTVGLVAKVRGFVDGIGTAKAATREFVGELDTMGQRHREQFDRIASTTAIAGAGLIGVFGLAVKAAMDFDRQMSEVGAVSNATSGELDGLRAAALQAGKDTAYSATQAAEAESNLAKAGISTADILGGALTGSLALAAAGSLDLAEAADVAAKTMNIFQLRGSDVGHIADVLAASANKSATDVHEMGEALKQGGMVAANVGLSLEDTAGTLAAFADHALAGSDAGTSLKTMLQMLANPSKEASGLMRELGIHAYDTAGNFVGVDKLAGQLQTSLGGLTQAERDAAFATIFGSDATRAAQVLYGQGEAGIRDYIDAVNDQGAAQDVARQKTDNLAGDIERLKGSIETLAIQSGSGANGGLRMLTQWANGAIDAFSDLPPWVQQSITVIAGLSGAGLLGATGLMKVRQSAADAMQALRDMGPVGDRAAGALGKVGSIAGKAGAWGLGVFVLVEAFSAFSNWAEKRVAPAKANIDGLTDSIAKFTSRGEAAGELAKMFGQDLAKLADDINKVQKGSADLAQTIADVQSGLSAPEVMDGWDPIDKQAAQHIQDVDAALAKLVNGGSASTAALFLDQLQASGKLSSSELDRLRGMLPQYSAAADKATVANSGLARGFADTKQSAAIMNLSLQDAINKGQKLTDVWNTLNGAVSNSDSAMLAASQAIDNVAESFKTNGNAIEGNTQKALANRVAIEEATRKAAEAAQAKYEETGSIQQANATYNEYISQLKKTMSQAHLTDAQINELINRIGKMPPLVPITFSTPGLGGALDNVALLKARLAGIDRRIDIKAQFTYSYGGAAHSGGGYSTGQRYGGVTEYAETGLLRDASIFNAVGQGARYGFAEPGTGGEAFIPKYGDMARSRSIWEYVGRHWLGMDSAATGGAKVENHVHLYEGRATATQVEAVLRRQEIEARVGRPG